MDRVKYYKNLIREHKSELIDTAEKMFMAAKEIVNAAMVCVEALNRGGTVYVFGCGGSAAQANHFAAELQWRFKKDSRTTCARKVVSLTNAATLTAVTNDIDLKSCSPLETILSNCVCKKDIIFGISTTGRGITGDGVFFSRECFKKILLTSKNFYENREYMHRVVEHKDVLVIEAPGKDTARIQELHLFVLHCIAELIERETTE
jgi:D-sedoheptulose 7-phosphate isomerase